MSFEKGTPLAAVLIATGKRVVGTCESWGRNDAGAYLVIAGEDGNTHELFIGSGAYMIERPGESQFALGQAVVAVNAATSQIIEARYAGIEPDEKYGEFVVIDGTNGSRYRFPPGLPGWTIS